MTVEDARVIDMVTVDRETGMVWLTISDHLPWDTEHEDEHLLALQEKINSYVAFFESGQIFEEGENLRGRETTIHVAMMYSPSARASWFLSRATGVVRSAGLDLRVEHGSARSVLKLNDGL